MTFYSRRRRLYVLITFIFATIIILLEAYWITNDSDRAVVTKNDKFAVMGIRSQDLKNLLDSLDESSSYNPWLAIGNVVRRKRAENLAINIFPFLRHPTNHQAQHLSELRRTYASGSRGIVIPVGAGNIHLAGHLIAALRNVHKVELPIAIAYGGDRDLPPSHRERLAIQQPSLIFVDVTTILEDEFMGVQYGSWAIKPFAILASPFEEVILADADAVFVQPPQNLFEEAGYIRTGTFFFHDRRLEKVKGSERQIFIHSQTTIANPESACCPNILVDDWTDEQDSGVVVLNKKMTAPFVGLLHTCWQNSASVRDEITYKLFYGDKETFWLGMELTGGEYAFEENYSGIIGVLKVGGGESCVCGNTISHYDSKGHLLWYNGGLLHNKVKDLDNFLLPTHHMLNGSCSWGEYLDLSFCCCGGTTMSLNSEETNILQESIVAALGSIQ